MFDRLIDLLMSFGEHLSPIGIINDYEEAVLLRWGKFKKVLKSGRYFKYPLIDKVIENHITVTTLSLPAQSLYTQDKQNIVVKGVIKYKVSDIKIFIIEVFDATDALADMTQAIIKEVIINSTLDQCLGNEIDNTITKKTRIEAKKWGIEVKQVTLTDIAPIKSFRLIGDIVKPI